MTRAFLIAIAACLLLAACSAEPHLFKPGPAAGNPGAADGFSATLLRGASGAPSGVRVRFDPAPDVVGYNLYRSASPIPDTAVGDTGLQVNAALIPDSAGTVSYDDLFPTNVGDSWHYRVSSVDADGDESELSPESAITISDFIVTKLLTLTGGVGDSVEIEGQNFGVLDPTSDFVCFPGVTFAPGVGFTPDLIEAVITDQQVDRITCTVPLGATTGKVVVRQHGLDQSTPEDFTNTDPYIESLSPTTGTTDDQVTVTGANFGAAMDATHTLRINGETLPAVQIDSYSPNQIVYRSLVKDASSFGAPQNVDVRVGVKISNSGQFSLTARPPVPALLLNPPDAPTPATVDLDASASSDPDNGDTLAFAWDFEGDGSIDLDSGNDPTVTHVYDKSGDYTVHVYVRDLAGNVGDGSAPLHITLSRLQLLDNGNFVPGAELFETHDIVQINYILQDGEPDYSIDWILEDPNNRIDYKLATDTGLTPGLATSRQFVIDSTNPVPQPNGNVIPAGTWRIRAEAHDGGVGNDPDPILSWPNFADGSPGNFKVYRANVLFVIDAEGDPLASESQFINQILVKSGYKTGAKPSPVLALGDMTSRDVVIWAADGPHGPSSYEWLGRADLILASQYMDTGGALIIFGPPNGSGVKPFDQLQTFSDNYQSFDLVSQAFPPANMTAHDFTAGSAGGHPIFAATSSSSFGGADVATPPPGAFHSTQLDFVNSNGVPASSGEFTSNDLVGWRTYVGMFQPSKLSVIDPPGATVDHLMDNIVWNTAKKLP